MAVADFNSDGKPDIAVWIPNSQLLFPGFVLFGNGDGTFRSGPSIPGGTPWIADINGDKSPDIADGVAKLNSGVISVLLNDSPGDGFLTAGVSSATLTWPIGPVSIASAFGTNLAPQTAAASGNSSPTTFGGIRVHVRDSRGDTLAPLI